MDARRVALGARLRPPQSCVVSAVLWAGLPPELMLNEGPSGEGPSGGGLSSHDGSYKSLNRLAAMAQTPSKPLEPEEKWEQMSPRVYRNLDEIFAGEYEGLTYEDIKQRQPREAELRKSGNAYPLSEFGDSVLN